MVTFSTAVAAWDTMPKEDYTRWTHARKVFFNTSATGGDVKTAVADFPMPVRLNANILDFTQGSLNYAVVLHGRDY